MDQIINEKDNNNFETLNLKINFIVERIYSDISSFRINIEEKSFTLSELQKKTESEIRDSLLYSGLGFMAIIYSYKNKTNLYK